MSKIGKKPISIPEGTRVEIKDRLISVNGKEGMLEVPILEYLKVEQRDNQIIISPLAGHKQARANWGTLSALIRNALQGVKSGFTKILEIQGIGFRAQMEDATLVLTVGFTHPIKFEPPPGIKILVQKNVIRVSGADKNLVGETAAKIRKFKKPEPYKGKGIRYSDEVVRRKAGKKVAGTGTGT